MLVKAQASYKRKAKERDELKAKLSAAADTFDFHTLPRNARFRHRVWTHKGAVAVVEHTEYAIVIGGHRVTYTELAQDWEYSYDLVNWKAARP